MGLIGKQQSAMEKAVAEVDRAAELLARWEADAAAKDAELVDLEARAGADALDGPEGSAVTLASQIAGLRAGLDVAGRACVTARERLDQARRDVLTARVAELRAEALQVRAEADRRQVKTDRMLAELSEWEGGTRYVVYEPSRVEVQSAGVDGVPIRVPVTVMLRRRADALDSQASYWDDRAGQDADAVAASVAEVLSPVAG